MNYITGTDLPGGLWFFSVCHVWHIAYENRLHGNKYAMSLCGKVEAINPGFKAVLFLVEGESFCKQCERKANQELERTK